MYIRDIPQTLNPKPPTTLNPKPHPKIRGSPERCPVERRFGSGVVWDLDLHRAAAGGAGLEHLPALWTFWGLGFRV